MSFDFGDRVVVLHSTDTETAGIVGWHGKISGKSYLDDDPGNVVLAYAVAMDEAGGRTWMVDPTALQREPH
jgi:hypothetical protein